MSVERTVLGFAAAPLASSFILGAALSASSGADATAVLFGTLALGFYAAVTGVSSFRLQRSR